MESKAYLLHRRPYRDTSVICEFFSEDIGKISAVARAGRKRSGWQLALHPYIPLWIKWKGDHGLVRLTHCESVGPGINLTGHRLYCGFYLNELVTKLCPNAEENKALFMLYQDSIANLRTDDIAKTLRHFEHHFLRLLGYGLCMPENLNHAWYQYDGNHGLIPAIEHPQSFPCTHIQAILNQDWSVPGSLGSAKRLYRIIIDHLLPYPLQSRTLFHGLKQ